MTQAKKGDMVQVHYTGRLDDGTVFDSSLEREPLEFKLGSGMVIAGFDVAVSGMAVGETKTVRIPCAEAYGEHRAEMTLTVQRSQIPPDITPELGLTLSIRLEDGSTPHVHISALDEETVTLDANHPLAGKDLTFELALVKIC